MKPAKTVRQTWGTHRQNLAHGLGYVDGDLLSYLADRTGKRGRGTARSFAVVVRAEYDPCRCEPARAVAMSKSYRS